MTVRPAHHPTHRQGASGRPFRVALLAAAGVLGFLIFRMLPYFR